MVAATYDAAMARVFADEGGYTNDPVDPGGATNWGITIFDARKYWKADATPADVRNMPKAIAADIYRQHYAAPVRYDDLPAGFDYSVLDASINSGQGRAVPWAAKVLKSNSATVASIVTLSNAAPDKVSLIQGYWGLRLSFLHGLRTWSHFGGGWGRRVTNGEAAAVKMWLTIGAKLSAPDARKKLDEEAAKAKKSAGKAGTGAATTGAGGTIGAPSIDWSAFGGNVAFWLTVAVTVAVTVLFIRQAIIHSQRADAYAKA